MAWAEIIGLALRFFLLEFPRFLDKYKKYRLDKKYEDKQKAYDHALIEYLRAKRAKQNKKALEALRDLGKR